MEALRGELLPSMPRTLYVMPPIPIENSSSPHVSCHQKFGTQITSPSCWSQCSAAKGLCRGMHSPLPKRPITSGGSLPGPPDRLVPASGGIITHLFRPLITANQDAGLKHG